MPEQEKKTGPRKLPDLRKLFAGRAAPLPGLAARIENVLDAFKPHIGFSAGEKRMVDERGGLAKAQRKGVVVLRPLAAYIETKDDIPDRKLARLEKILKAKYPVLHALNKDKHGVEIVIADYKVMLLKHKPGRQP